MSKLIEHEERIKQLECHIDYLYLYLSTPTREDWEQEKLLEDLQDDIHELQYFQIQAEALLSVFNFLNRHKKWVILITLMVLLPMIDLFTHLDLTGWVARVANIPQIE
jgi:hypothetical protein